MKESDDKRNRTDHLDLQFHPNFASIIKRDKETIESAEPKGSYGREGGLRAEVVFLELFFYHVFQKVYCKLKDVFSYR